ncbi:hypothetical protein DV515_00019426 [Chloebia gouldiae]|uniref:Uncharacterized protein n=1 Tax=Chloebia gouldiae TaxID=44316 RepID=A0A3L8Q4S0_CHLGU|nr:hypothetical protein DV515_00019426 [Chloebia gouldiae]
MLLQSALPVPSLAQQDEVQDATGLGTECPLPHTTGGLWTMAGSPVCHRALGTIRAAAPRRRISRLPYREAPSVTQLLDSDGRISRGRNDQHPMAIRKQDASGPAASREPRPSTAPRHISCAPGLVQPLQPLRTATAPSQLEWTQRPVLDLGQLLRSEKRL